MQKKNPHFKTGNWIKYYSIQAVHKIRQDKEERKMYNANRLTLNFRTTINLREKRENEIGR